MTATLDLTTWIRISDPGSEDLGSGSYGSIEKLNLYYSLLTVLYISCDDDKDKNGPVAQWFYLRLKGTVTQYPVFPIFQCAQNDYFRHNI